MSEDLTGKTPVADLSPEEFEKLVAGWGEPPYRAGQILTWIYRRRARAWEDMTNLPRPLRTRLSDHLALRRTSVESTVRSRDGTVKLALRLSDNRIIEAAGIPAGGRMTACLSSQVGCAFACAFCASGGKGFVRQIATHEIIEQLFHLIDAARDITHVVFMGIGEPLANYRAISHAIGIITAPWAFDIARRRITVSTVGIPARIRTLARDHSQVNLALSLHAPNDVLRSRLIPANRRWPIADVMQAVRDHQTLTRRQPTFEYVVLPDVNDTPQSARELAALLAPMDCTINLIACSGTETDRAHARRRAREFQTRLARLGLRATLRRSRGQDIDAACGQLRARIEGQHVETAR